jgi:hypothetical protein
VRRARAGAALVEALVAGVLLSLVAATGTTLLRAQSRIAQDVTLRSERNDATRSAFLTLQAELQNIAPAADLRAIARDSVAARIFRGIAIVCGQRDAATFVRYRGLRLPDATKDSALQVGVENVVAIKTVSQVPDSCVSTGDDQVLALDFGISPQANSMWLIFESGVYHLSRNALRYRRSGETRQPITNEVIDVRRSSFQFTADSIIDFINVELRDTRTNAIAPGTIRLRNAR